MRILIIEDDKDLAQLTKLALEKENFTVDICLDGAEGLYHVIICSAVQSVDFVL